MREIISVHIGQAGVQVGNACWELFCLEHGIRPDGSSNISDDASDRFYNSFFHEIAPGKYKARSVFIDLETNVIDEIRGGPYRDLFTSDDLITGVEDAANVYGCGYYTLGRSVISPVLESIRKLMDVSENPDIIMFHSFGGGTGSGFGSLFMEAMAENYPENTFSEFVVFPSKRLATAVVEPYNAVLAMPSAIENSDLTYLMDNEALYEISEKLDRNRRPTYTNLNRIIGHVVSSITSSMRFEGASNVYASDMLTNLIPYPRIHFPLLSYAPLEPANRENYMERPSVLQLVNACFEPDNRLHKCDTDRGHYMSCCLLFRGMESQCDIHESVGRVKANLSEKFVDWCPTGFEIGVNNQPPVALPSSTIAPSERSAVMIANSTAVHRVWANLIKKFDALYRKKVFLHWFLSEGMEEEEFVNSRQNILDLRRHYEEAGQKMMDGEKSQSPANPEQRNTNLPSS